jgi:hypothetical protein
MCNTVGAETFSRVHGLNIHDHTYYCIDTECNKTGTDNAIPSFLQDMLWNAQPRLSNHIPGKLMLYPGLKIVIKTNLSIPHGICNGQEAIIEYIASTPHPHFPEKKTIQCLFVRLGSTFSQQKYHSKLPKGIVPIFPTRERVSVHLTSLNTNAMIYRSQVPILLNYGKTDYGCQSQGYEYAIINLTHSNTVHSIYTLLSRSREQKKTAIIGDINWKILTTPPKKDYMQFMFNLEVLHDACIQMQTNENGNKYKCCVTQQDVIKTWYSINGNNATPPLAEKYLVQQYKKWA